ncbi:MAG: hypothetical protein ABSE93_23550 [Terriglobia bacterium]|jgi:hypothetical protein
MSWKIHEFIDERGDRVLATWFRRERVQKKARILFDQKVDLLVEYGPELPSELLAGPVDTHIYKLKVRAQGTQLRPHLCKGPINNQMEYTFLCGAIERDGVLDPLDVADRAEQNRQLVIADPSRRLPYERFVPKTARRVSR